MFFAAQRTVSVECVKYGHDRFGGGLGLMLLAPAHRTLRALTQRNVVSRLPSPLGFPKRCRSKLRLYNEARLV
jgi:hypothetical protein